MEMLIESVHERDMDLLLMREILDNTNAGKWFVNEACGKGYTPVSVQHSKYDETGEADVAVILQGVNETLELFVEDKIDAEPQPQQHDRYIQRGELAIKNNECNRYLIVLFAPEKYLNSSMSAGYQKKISYESFQKQCPVNSYAYQLLDEAILKKNTGYTPVPDEKITAFWQEFYKFVAEEYPDLHPYITPGNRGPRAVWLPFKTLNKDTVINVKADRDHTDYEIGHYADKRNQFMKDNGDLVKGFQITEAGKSLAIRITTPELDFHQPFDQQIDKVRECLDAVRRLYHLEDNLKIERS